MSKSALAADVNWAELTAAAESASKARPGRPKILKFTVFLPCCALASKCFACFDRDGLSDDLAGMGRIVVAPQRRDVGVGVGRTDLLGGVPVHVDDATHQPAFRQDVSDLAFLDEQPSLAIVDEGASGNDGVALLHGRLSGKQAGRLEEAVDGDQVVAQVLFREGAAPALHGYTGNAVAERVRRHGPPEGLPTSRAPKSVAPDPFGETLRLDRGIGSIVLVDDVERDLGP